MRYVICARGHVRGGSLRSWWNFFCVCVRQSREKISKPSFHFSTWPRSSSANILIALTIPPATQANKVRGSLIALPLSWCYAQFLSAPYRFVKVCIIFIYCSFFWNSSLEEPGPEQLNANFVVLLVHNLRIGSAAIARKRLKKRL